MTAVEAAGGVVWRRGSDAGSKECGSVEIAVVHRPHRADWSLPKGHLHDGEDHLAAAVREVEEETGLTCAPGPDLGEVRYRDHKGRDKRVRYWAMTVTEGSFEANEEVDEVRWLPPEACRRLLTYPTDVEVIDRFVAVESAVESAVARVSSTDS